MSIPHSRRAIETLITETENYLIHESDPEGYYLAQPQPLTLRERLGNIKIADLGGCALFFGAMVTPPVKFTFDPNERFY